MRRLQQRHQIKNVSIIFPSLFCAISLRAKSALAGAAVKAL
jgi:hypothetical protein